MTTLAGFFSNQADSSQHPLVRKWQKRLEQPARKVTLEVFSPECDIGVVQADMVLHFTENDKALPP